MQVIIRITTDNAAFGDNDQERAIEVARILRDYCNKIEERSELYRVFYDYNGNRVGEVEITD